MHIPTASTSLKKIGQVMATLSRPVAAQLLLGWWPHGVHLSAKTLQSSHVVFFNKAQCELACGQAWMAIHGGFILNKGMQLPRRPV